MLIIFMVTSPQFYRNRLSQWRVHRNVLGTHGDSAQKLHYAMGLKNSNVTSLFMTQFYEIQVYVRRSDMNRGVRKAASHS